MVLLVNTPVRSPGASRSRRRARPLVRLLLLVRLLAPALRLAPGGVRTGVSDFIRVGTRLRACPFAAGAGRGAPSRFVLRCFGRRRPVLLPERRLRLLGVPSPHQS